MPLMTLDSSWSGSRAATVSLSGVNAFDIGGPCSWSLVP
jgi:hypothetical protein